MTDSDSQIQSMKSGFGFITPALGGSNLFFFHGEVINADFNDLRAGDPVRYAIGRTTMDRAQSISMSPSQHSLEWCSHGDFSNNPADLREADRDS